MRLHKIFFFILFVAGSCMENKDKVEENYKVEEFSSEDLKWYKPYDSNQTVIYVSGKNEYDTIIFHKAVSTSDSTRDFEQGFSNTNYLSVPYEFTKDSYHQFAIMGDRITRR